jgi:hypothetical protein
MILSAFAWCAVGVEGDGGSVYKNTTRMEGHILAITTMLLLSLKKL